MCGIPKLDQMFVLQEVNWFSFVNISLPYFCSSVFLHQRSARLAWPSSELKGFQLLITPFLKSNRKRQPHQLKPIWKRYKPWLRATKADTLRWMKPWKCDCDRGSKTLQVSFCNVCVDPELIYKTSVRLWYLCCMLLCLVDLFAGIRFLSDRVSTGRLTSPRTKPARRDSATVPLLMTSVCWLTKVNCNDTNYRSTFWGFTNTNDM